MTKLFKAALSLLLGGLFFCNAVLAQPVGDKLARPADSQLVRPADDPLQIVLIRHGEKPKKGDNLTCQGLNRALALPGVLYAKFGIPSAVYVPALGLGDSTKHARMFETALPLAVKYNLALNSKFAEKDSAGIAAEILGRKGVVLVVWEHKAIAPIAHALGVADNTLKWGDEDYDSIWVITFSKGAAVLMKAEEGLKPGEGCPF